LYACEDIGTGARAVCPFAERNWRGYVDIFTPVGFSGFARRGEITAQMRAAWADFVARRGYVCGYFALHPQLADQSLNHSLSSRNDLYVLDLTRGAQAVLANCDRSVKRAVRDWRQCGQELSTDRDELTRFVVANHAHFMRERQAAVGALWPAATLELMCRSENMMIAGVRDNSGVCAVHTFGLSPTGAECHLNIWVRGGRQFTTALLWWGIERLSEAGVPWLNMGGGVRAGDAIASSKEKFRPLRVPFVAAREIYRQHLYVQLCQEAGQCAPDSYGYFPAYRSEASFSPGGSRTP
jgi:hypothetical protein